MGANGAGKTTLIKVLMNIFRSSSGNAQVLGIECLRSGELDAGHSSFQYDMTIPNFHLPSYQPDGGAFRGSMGIDITAGH